MKIAIDARWIFPEISGIGAYTRELIRNLSELDTRNEYVLFFNNKLVRERTIMETGIANKANFKSTIINYDLFSIKNQMFLPGILARENIDIFHSTNYMIPIFAFPRNRKGRTKCITTIHDVIPMIFRDHAPRSKKARMYPVYRRLMLEIGIRSDTIITDSKASAADIIKHLQIRSDRTDKVQYIYCGVSDSFKPPLSRTTLSETEKRRILYVGRSDPYKNVTTLVKSFSKIQASCPFPVELVIAGSVDQRYPETRELAQKLDLMDSVRWTGYITDQELVELYQSSNLLIHPSRYEGFGLQILEAMACGLPVICTNTGSQPEVSGNAAVILDPDDSEGMARNAYEILSDSARIEDIRQKGLEQASRFTWQKTAQKTLEIYEVTVLR